MEGNCGVKRRKQGSNKKGKCNSPIFLPFVGHYVVCLRNIGLLHFPLLFDPCFLPFYTTIAFQSYMPPTLSHRMFLLLVLLAINAYMYLPVSKCSKLVHAYVDTLSCSFHAMILAPYTFSCTERETVHIVCTAIWHIFVTAKLRRKK